LHGILLFLKVQDTNFFKPLLYDVLSHLNSNIYLIIVVNILLLYILISPITIRVSQQMPALTSVSQVEMKDTPQQKKSEVSGLALALSSAKAGSNCIKKIAFVRPSFTYAAYQLNGFYNFYRLHGDVSGGKNVTEDLNLLTVKIPHGPFLVYTQKPTEVPEPIREKRYIDKLMELLASQFPVDSVDISDISDEQVHDGKIFNNNTNRSSNAYDTLFLFHQEYATPDEYYNLKKFVENGGTIIFNDANIFTTEVRYNSTNDTVTFVEGHDWKYNGQSAWRAEKERWADETRQWIGSNFLQVPTKRNVTFTNNPFGYNHTEEQYLTNPNDRIIFDFDAKIPDVRDVQIDNSITLHPTVAVYELDHNSGNKTGGKVISLSIFSYKLLNSKEFLDFYVRRIIPLAVDNSNCD
jgi:hypothetical protein